MMDDDEEKEESDGRKGTDRVPSTAQLLAGMAQPAYPGLLICDGCAESECAEAERWWCWECSKRGPVLARPTRRVCTATGFRLFLSTVAARLSPLAAP